MEIKSKNPELCVSQWLEFPMFKPDFTWCKKYQISNKHRRLRPLHTKSNHCICALPRKWKMILLFSENTKWYVCPFLCLLCKNNNEHVNLVISQYHISTKTSQGNFRQFWKKKVKMTAFHAEQVFHGTASFSLQIMLQFLLFFCSTPRVSYLEYVCWTD